MAIRFIAYFLIFAVMMTSCNLAGRSDDSAYSPDTLVEDVQVLNEEDSEEEMQDNITVDNNNDVFVPEFDGDFSAMLSDFSNEIYRGVTEANSKNNNIIFSPLSVVYALALASNGAEGRTKTEFEAIFGGATVDRMNDYLLTLTNALATSKESKVVVGNSIWANKNKFTFSSEYLSVAEKYYSAEARSLAFNQQAVGEINTWVREKTDGMIPKAIDSLSPELAMVLFNTVLFDGKWEKEYYDSDISDGKFYNYDGSASKVEYLFSKENGKYFEVEGGVGFSKEYKDGYLFTAVLPSGDINEFMKKADVAEIIAASRASRENVRVYIPKFEYDFSTPLNSVLQSMGLVTAFSSEADFDKMADNGDTDIAISHIFQIAKIILNEHGTKAAAVTGMTYGTTSMPTQRDRLIRLEKPFLYIIQDENGTPLFIGTVYNLEQAN